MNLRHAAALALVGWYLMMPPVNSDNTVDLDAPLSKWIVGASFDAANQCETVRAMTTTPVQWKADIRAAKKAGRLPLTRAEYDKRVEAAQCVATDDPRLKGN
jgi:hypothetical protein